ncbi:MULTISPECIES: TlyA family rRNA (cytidine-2'-O)-methyltransferase [Thermodesulfovibrio]|uniref:Hemolysin A n=2 Tax=Thermodesulfovibrio yellowstonii TaxID=28262 RepID=B5YHY6_THEYD|nr:MULTISPECIES: TlyA family rRNA (cytidine-2'-O)-methyltransferase [Thermodesulfovibrio]ACI20213.1 hemolysin A [Thermodesulfovibrio yellowstonii DSM 11347]MDI6864725.1 TlyA family rRNA (cytidine-2'-O)-methyltransferase [Thermodesulfovibrio yellowstonii]GLI54389.1 TlyA family rRNA (cytidine-2'-O)-methyltransferase [Thermodesulfovibrio islandicus]
MKLRLDQLLFKKGITESREKARALIIEGKVIVNGHKIEKPGTMVDENSEITICGETLPYVSRGGFKLEHAIKEFSIDVKDKVVMDVGASTGGFTDCLLQHGAKKVYAIDVGYGQLAWKLRTDPRVIPIERTNIRYMGKDKIPEDIDIVTVDVSFISLKLVIPKVLEFLKPQGKIIALIKPQFEVGKGEVESGGVVKSFEKRKRVVEEIKNFFASLGLKVIGVIESPIKGQKGNIEYLIYAKTSSLS